MSLLLLYKAKRGTPVRRRRALPVDLLNEDDDLIAIVVALANRQHPLEVSP